MKQSKEEARRKKNKRDKERVEERRIAQICPQGKCGNFWDGTKSMCPKCLAKSLKLALESVQKSKAGGHCWAKGCKTMRVSFSNFWCNYHWFYNIACNARKRAKIRNIPASAPKKLTGYFIALWKKQKGKCRYCRKKLVRGILNHQQGAEGDQILPGYGYIENNIAWACKACNNKKQNFSILDLASQEIIRIQKETVKKLQL